MELTDASLRKVRRGAPTAELSVAKERKKPSRERRGDLFTNSPPPNSLRMGYQDSDVECISHCTFMQRIS